MFDIGFLEIVVVGIVALVVLGPERLPGTIRTVSLWIGRLRRSFNNIRQDIEKEIGADEIRRQLRNEEIMEKFRHTQNQVQNSISAIKKETDEFKKNVDLEARIAGSTSSKPAPENQPTTEQSVPSGQSKATDSPVAPAAASADSESAEQNSKP